jgi:hypothetical protein
VRCQFHLHAVILFFLLTICSAKGDPIVLSVEGGPAVSFGGSASTIIVASAPATISITGTGTGSAVGPSVRESLDFAPLGGGQGLFDPAHASWSFEGFGFGPAAAGAFCGGSFVGNSPVLLQSFSCTEAIGPGLYTLSVSLQFGPNIVFNMPTSGSVESTVTLVSGGPIAVAPEPASFILCATGMGLFIALAGIRGQRSRISGAGWSWSERQSRG